MNLKVFRVAHGKDSTLGILRLDDEFHSFVVEDEYRAVKVKGETRIPAGKYRIKFREEPSPKTESYRRRYDWFHWHLELQDVPGFKHVYIHIGNDDDDTEGCLLVGYIGQKIGSEYTVGQSTDAFRNLYAKCKRVLDAGEDLWIEIRSL